MRDYRFFFLAEAFRGLKTTDFVSRGTFSRTVAQVFHVEQKTKSRANPALLFHVEQSPTDPSEGIVSGFQDQSRHNNQEQLAHKPAAMLQR